jgi:hypothetical protein
MKWNWIKDGGPPPTEYEYVLCAEELSDGDFFYLFGWWFSKRGWIYAHNHPNNGTPPDAWCYIKPPVKPSEDE